MQDKVKGVFEQLKSGRCLYSFKSTFKYSDAELGGTYYPLEGMTKEVQTQLIKDHFLFKEGDRFLQAANACRYWPTGRGIYHNDKKVSLSKNVLLLNDFFQTFLVWVNEEDHLRIISMQNGGNVGQVLERLIKGVKAIETKVPFSRDDRLGWLTFCPSNLVCFEFVVSFFDFLF